MSLFDDILSRIKEVVGVKTDSEVAKLLGLKPNTLAERKSRNSVPYEELFMFSNERDLNLDWLLTGEGTKCREEKVVPGIIKEPPAEYGNKKLDDLVKRIQYIYKEGSIQEKALIRGTIEEVYDILIEKIVGRLKQPAAEHAPAPELKKTNDVG